MKSFFTLATAFAVAGAIASTVVANPVPADLVSNGIPPNEPVRIFSTVPPKLAIEHAMFWPGPMFVMGTPGIEWILTEGTGKVGLIQLLNTTNGEFCLSANQRVPLSDLSIEECDETDPQHQWFVPSEPGPISLGTDKADCLSTMKMSHFPQDIAVVLEKCNDSPQQNWDVVAA